MSAPLLAVEGLTLAAAGRVLVHRLDLTVEPGQRWCVIGRNASGKSTLLRALAGLGVPSLQGTVRLQGQPGVLDDAAQAARLRAYMPQQSQDRFDLPVRDLLALQAGSVPVQDGWLGDARALDVADLLDRPVTHLSGGERQRVALAAVAQQGAPLWLLDEPVSFQDPAHQQQVSHWLRAQASRALLMSAHDMAWVQGTATHVLALTGRGFWTAGPLDAVLQADTLRATFGCEWRQVGGIWMAAV